MDTHVEIIAGFDDNSKSEKSQTPLWQQSFNIKPRSVIDMRGPGFSAPMQTAYWSTDNCLYGNPSIYPIIAPPVFYKPNKEYTSMWEITFSDVSHSANIMGFRNGLRY